MAEPQKDYAVKTRAAISSYESLPTGPDIDLAPVEKLIEETNARQKSYQDQMEATRNRAKTSVEAAKQALDQQAAADVIITEANANQVMEAESTQRAVFTAAGGLDYLTAELSRLKEASLEAEQAQKDFHEARQVERTGIGLLDDLINSFASIPEATRADLAVEKQKQIALNINAVAGATQHAAQTALAAQETVSVAERQASMDKIRAVASLEKAKLDIQASQTDAHSVAALYSMSGDELTNKFKYLSVLESQQGRAMQRRAQELELARLEASLKDVDKDTTVAAQLVANVQEGQRRAGKAPADAATITYLLQRGDKDTVGYLNLGATGSYGGSFWDSMRNADALGRPPTGAASINMEQELLSYIGSRPELKQQFEAATEQEKATLMNTYAEKLFGEKGEQRLLVKEGDISNPFHLPPSKVIEGIKAVQEDPLYKKVLQETLKTQPNAGSQAVFDSAVAGLKAGTITLKEAEEGFLTWHRAGVEYNNTYGGGFSRYGVAPQTYYRTLLKVTTPNRKSMLESLGRQDPRFGLVSGEVGGGGAAYLGALTYDLLSKNTATAIPVISTDSVGVRAAFVQALSR